MHDFFWKHFQEFVQLHPRPEALETPIDIVEETRTDWRDNPYKVKRIQAIDNA